MYEPSLSPLLLLGHQLFVLLLLVHAAQTRTAKTVVLDAVRGRKEKKRRSRWRRSLLLADCPKSGEIPA